MKILKLVGILLLIISMVSAETTIIGNISTLNSSKPLADCNIYIEGTDIGTTSDKYGEFILQLKFDDDIKLVVSHIGYKTEEILVKLEDSGIAFVPIVMQPQILDYDLVTVTGTKSERRLMEVPGRLEVITAKHLEKYPAQKLDDILTFISGLNVHRTSGIYEIRPIVSLRGVSGDEAGRALILIDGIPINKTDTGVANWNRINLNNIEQIEIFKGSGSSLYGNNAMGGTINLITKKPIKDFNGNFTSSYGTYNTKNLNFKTGKNIINNLYIDVTAFYRGSDGYYDIPDSLHDEYTVPLFVNEIGLSTKLSYYLNDNASLSVAYDFYDDKRGEGVRIKKRDGEHREFDTNTINATFQKENKSSSYEINGFLQVEDYIRVDEAIKKGEYSQYDVKSDRTEKGLLGNYSLDIGDLSSITVGAELKSGSVDGGDYYSTSTDSLLNRGQLRTLSSYLQYEIGLFNKKINLVSSLRMDDVKFHDGYFSANSLDDPLYGYNGEIEDNRWRAFSPRVALRYNINNIGVYASYSRGFRAATLDDLCRTGWMRLGVKLANPELGPETIDSYELGFDIAPFQFLKISPTVYYSKGHDFLYYVDTGDLIWNKKHIYKRENITGVDIQGAECDLVLKPNDLIAVMLNYTYNESTISSFVENPDLEGKYLIYSPLHQFKSVVQLSNGLLDVNFGAVYKSEQYTSDYNSEKIDGYWLLNCQLSKEIFNNVKIDLDIQNITDQRITETAERLSPGRLVNINLTYKW